jgi:WD40 repeat protein
LHCWDVATAQEQYTWTPQIGFVNAIAFNPQNPEIIALMSMERELIGNNGMRPFNTGIELWNGRKFIQRYNDFRQFYSEGYNKLNDRLLEFGHDGKTVFVCLFNGDGFGHGGQVLAWEGLGDGSLRAVTEPGVCFYEMRLNRQGNHLAVSNAPEGKLSIHDIESGAIVYNHIDTEQLPYQLEFDSTGNILAVGRNPKNRTEGRIDLINLTRGEKIWELPINHVGEVAFSPDNTLMVIEITGNRKSGNQAIVFWGIPQ